MGGDLDLAPPPRGGRDGEGAISRKGVVERRELGAGPDLQRDRSLIYLFLRGQNAKRPRGTYHGRIAV
jgi:hypothetical protein